MRESRLSGSVEGVMSDHDSYSDFTVMITHSLIGYKNYFRAIPAQ
jgi:hypothetical protein